MHEKKMFYYCTNKEAEKFQFAFFSIKNFTFSVVSHVYEKEINQIPSQLFEVDV